MAAQLPRGSSAFESGGTILAYEVRGTGPAAIAVPYMEGFDRVALRVLFGPVERVLTLSYFDPPGLGRSGPPVSSDDRSPARALRDLESFRRRLGLDRVGLVGHGSGGRLALVYAAGHPTVLAFLILSGASATNEFEAGDPTLFDREEVAVAWHAARRQPTPEAFWGWHRAMRSAEPSPAVRRALDRIESESAGIDPARLDGAARDLEGLDVRPLLKLVRAPTLVLAGRKDRVAPPRLQETLARSLPNAKYVEFPRAGHYVMVEDREPFVGAVRAFVRGLPA